MNAALIVSIAFLISLGVFIWLLKRRLPNDKFRHTVNVIGLICCGVSIAAIGISFYFSGDWTQLYKITLPGLMILILVSNIRRGRKEKNQLP